MLTLNTGSVCDVCSEDYGPHCMPHSIPCGHVLCASCCNSIIEKTSHRLSPVCPFCREQFTSDSVRLIRIDFTASRWNTPRMRHTTLDTHDIQNDVGKHEDRILFMNTGSKTREAARRLEDKVAKVAAKKCSVEEVSTLHKELQQWLMSDVKSDEQTSSLSLSAALLRAILVNHLAHSEANKMAKTVESNLKAKLDDAEITNGKLEAELRRQKLQYSQKVQECQSLRSELNRLKLITTTLGTQPARSSSVSPTSDYPQRPPSTSPTPPSTYNPASPSPLSRFTSSHLRSVSMNASSRPTTPATLRSHAPSIRSHTPAPRSHTPSIRSQTPGPAQAPPPTPAPPPPIPPKPRRLSHPSPPKMMRSVSEEKEEEKVHQRWIPPHDPTMYSPPKSFAYAPGLARPASAAPGSRSFASSRQTPVSRYTSAMNAT